MAEDIRALSAQLAQDPQSLVFLRLGEALRRHGQLGAALRVAMNGLERRPHLADAHDLYARVLTDKHDYEHAFDEWDMTVQIAPNHTGALKGLAFLYFKVGDIAQAEAHLETARKIEPGDPTIDQAIAMVRGGITPPEPVAPEPAAPEPVAPESAAPSPPGAAGNGAGAPLAGERNVSTALDLITRVRGVRGAMLVSADDGIVVAEQLMEGIKGSAVAALAASLAGRLRRAMEAAGTGASVFWHLQGEQGALLVVPGGGGGGRGAAGAGGGGGCCGASP